MLNPAKTFVLLSTILIISCASGPSGKSFDSAVGKWSWQLESPSGRWFTGNMTIIDKTKATYTYGNGRIFFYAIDDQGKWEGYWVENSGGGQQCSDKKDGSTYWGVAIFQFNDAYNKLSGTYDQCGAGPKFIWDGHR